MVVPAWPVRMTVRLLVLGGCAKGEDLDIEGERDAGERVVAIDLHAGRGHTDDPHRHRIAARPFRHEFHTDFDIDVFGESGSRELLRGAFALAVTISGRNHGLELVAHRAALELL